MHKTSQSSIRRVIKYWLERPPEAQNEEYSIIKHVIFDGTYLNRPWGIYASMNSESHQIIKAESNLRETSKDLLSIYNYLILHGLNPVSATVDGHLQQIKALKLVWPEIMIQRCIIHVQRQGLSWCRRNPKRTDAKYLRELFLVLTEVKTEVESERYIKAVKAWENRFGSIMKTSSNRGPVFSDILRARSMLTKALPDLFHFVNNPQIAKSTNALEGYFSRLKESYRLHRGLSRANRINYFKWYFYLKPK